MEVVTVWIPVYVFSAVVKIFTALSSVATAIALPVTMPRIFSLIRQAKVTEETTAHMRASEERKESLGLRLVRLLTRQIRGSFELVRSSPGTSAHLQFAVEPHVH